MINSLHSFFKPRGVAVIGASSKPNKLSYGIVKNLNRYHYAGAVYPINPNADEIFGYQCYPDVRQVPDPVDLAVIVLPAEMTLGAVQGCAERGIKAVVIISGGFREVGPQGKAIEDACVRVAEENGMRIIGPNCVGTMDMITGCNTTFIEGMPTVGPIAFVSQSGAVCGGVVDLIINKEVGFSYFASLGNEADVTETDMIEYFGEDDAVKVIAVYIEGIRDGQRFIQVAKKVTRKKPVVVLKAGKSTSGAKAVSSHTGSLAGSHAAYSAAFTQSGVIEVEDIHTLFNVAWGLGCQPLPAGKGVAIVTNAGGPAALASDSLDANGFYLAELYQETKETLRENLNPSAQVANPVDILGAADPREYDWSLKNLVKDDHVDVLLPILVPQAIVNPAEVARVVAENAARTHKTILACIMGDASVAGARSVLHQHQVPMLQYPEDIGSVLNGMYAYRTYLQQASSTTLSHQTIDQAAAHAILQRHSGTTAMGEVESRLLLQACSIPVVRGDFASSAEDAVAIADRIGYPVVMKIVSGDILHKSDAGGIRLALASALKVQDAFTEMLSSIKHHFPSASLDGVLIEKMVPKGQEVIIGMRRDPTFGPLIMFGMGGVLVELIKDVSFKVAPLTHGDIDDLIASTYAGRLLAGFRGSPRLDIPAVSQIIAQLSQLAIDFPGIAEIEINPLVVFAEGQGALSLDSRAILQGKA